MTIVVVEDLHKRYGRVQAVAGVSFEVEEGEIFGILGPNGAGKTTTVECIEGLVRPDSGTVTAFGLDPTQDGGKLRQIVGAQLQQAKLPGKLRVIEALKLYASFYPDPEDPEVLLERTGLREKRKAAFEDLSGGQQQRLSIALALVGRPRLAILDELTTGLDPRSRRSMWDLVSDIRASGVTVLLVTHFMEEAQRLCDRIALLDEGKVVALDTPAGLVRRVSDEMRLSFRPSRPVEDKVFRDLPSVMAVRREGEGVVVSGTGNVLQEVSSALQQLDVTPVDLTMQQATLDDAFLQLTGKSLEADSEDAEQRS